ncbi:MAG: DUF4040 domain-containing protein [Cyanobacteria bacterium J083]|nr:MAG: DUF4040 domain-containing protein [Cyanobacteria bacterium J083]
MIDKYIYIIVALLPLSALVLVTQKNPYHALVIKAILGGVAVLVYAVLGAADVALTEAMVGTMLGVTLYVIAVRSSLVMRLGIVEELKQDQESHCTELITHLRQIIKKHHLRLELVEYPNQTVLKQALNNQEIHGICLPKEELESQNNNQALETIIRVRHLFEILQTELTFPPTTLNYLATYNKENKH